jgi:hypothetical protein
MLVLASAAPRRTAWPKIFPRLSAFKSLQISDRLRAGLTFIADILNWNSRNFQVRL